MRAFILAGGRGSRMGEATETTPKPLLPVCGKPILQYQLDLLKENGIKDITLLTGYLGHCFEALLGDGSDYGVRLQYIQEKEPMGTAGALLALKDIVDDDFLVLSGDIMLNLDVERFIHWHREKQNAAVSVVVHPNDHPLDSDLVETDHDARIIALHTRPHPEGFSFQNLSIASVYIYSPGILNYINADLKTDLEKHLFPVLLQNHLPLFAYNTHEYLKDAGTPQRISKVTRDIQAGHFERSHRRYARKAVFLDRDGVINVEKGHILSEQDFELIPGVLEAIHSLNESGFLVIVVTNQSALAKGFLELDGLHAIHKRLETDLGTIGAHIDAFYYCPHHPEKGFVGERPELKKNCLCRKPETGMIEQACRDFHIDKSRSFFIGDSTTDYLAASRAGVSFWGVQTGHALNDPGCELPPDLRLGLNLLEVTQSILSDLKTV